MIDAVNSLHCIKDVDTSANQAIYLHSNPSDGQRIVVTHYQYPYYIKTKMINFDTAEYEWNAIIE